MTEICQNCKLAHNQEMPCVAAQAAAMIAILGNIGDPGTCRGCQVKIYWVTHKNGKKTPYTPAGLNHFVDCEARSQFAK